MTNENVKGAAFIILIILTLQRWKGIPEKKIGVEKAMNTGTTELQ